MYGEIACFNANGGHIKHSTSGSGTDEIPLEAQRQVTIILLARAGLPRALSPESLHLRLQALVWLQAGAANHTRVPAAGQPLLQLTVRRALLLPLLAACYVAAGRIWIQAQELLQPKAAVLTFLSHISICCTAGAIPCLR